MDDLSKLTPVFQTVKWYVAVAVHQKAGVTTVSLSRLHNLFLLRIHVPISL
jgi:hypothetical protein